MAEEKKKKIVIKRKKPTIKIRIKNKTDEQGEKTEKSSTENKANKTYSKSRTNTGGSGAGRTRNDFKGKPGNGPKDKKPFDKNKGKGTGTTTTTEPAKKENKKIVRNDWKKKKGFVSRKTKEKEFKLKRKEKREAAIPDEIEIPETILVKELAKNMNLKVGDLIKKLMELGYMATINDALDQDTAEIVATEFGCKVKLKSVYEELKKMEEVEEDPGNEVVRPPVVTVMGHVDHGKTSLLDFIRTSRVAAKESGGITQHIGAYQVELPEGKITFIDTPGHAAFTQMRERGAAATDIVILVVAADDGVMPQTVEAINHAQAAGVPIIVAVNKIDKENANPDIVKQQLSERGILPEDWGGDVMFKNISALKGIGINELLEAILLEAEMKELKGHPDRRGKAVILETKVDKSKGSTATVVVKDGTLKKGDFFVAGTETGKIRAMFNYQGKQLKEAPPSTPVEIIGFDKLPEAGDILLVFNDEKTAKEIRGKREEIKRIEHAKRVTKKVSLDDLYQKMQDGQKEDLHIIVKADVQGTAEAIKNMIEKLSDQIQEVNLKVIHSTVGAITENDILLASASSAIVVGFNARPNNEKVVTLSKEKGVEIRKYSVIYEIIDDIKSAVEGMLAPEEKEEVLGQVEVRDLFKVPKIGVIAGCYVTEGLVKRTARVRVIREGIVLHDGKISSLKRFKDDAKEVAKGYECGIGIDNYKDLKAGDTIEVYEINEVAKKLTLVDKVEKTPETVEEEE